MVVAAHCTWEVSDLALSYPVKTSRSQRTKNGQTLVNIDIQRQMLIIPHECCGFLKTNAGSPVLETDTSQ